MTANPARLQEMRIEWEAERRVRLANIARERELLRDVNDRLKVFFGEGVNG